MNIRVFYYSSVKDKGNIVETAVPVVNDKLVYSGISERPTVLWFMSPNRDLLTPVYIEPGDELAISGEYGKPLSWKLVGNEIEEKWGEWREKHAKALESGNDRVINGKIDDVIAQCLVSLAEINAHNTVCLVFHRGVFA